MEGVLTDPAPAAERLAAALRDAHPDAEPLDLHPDELAAWVVDAGGDPADEPLLAAALAAWEGMLL
ncbi:MAG: hypothetical protein QOD86_2706 [Miltoncostaeaceae bacterium]|nr:hypothetical protein [Miltoncostaeaceae bacterium]